MAIIAKLCNPTPFDAEIHYQAGRVLNIPAFGELALTIQQMDDYRDDKPGSEDALEDLIFWGVFLKNDDRTYEDQALESVKKALNYKRTRFNEGVKNLQRLEQRRPGGGNTDEKELVKILGFEKIEHEIKTLEKLEKHYQAAVTETGGRRVRDQYDPTRTVFIPDQKPKVFPTPAAMAWFLDQPENKTIKTYHNDYISKLKKAEKEAA